MRPRPDPVGPGQQSVWSYPRPAIAQSCAAHVMIEHDEQVIADTRASVRTLETSHPPTYYIPPDSIAAGILRRAEGYSFCEWKGSAVYWDAIIGATVMHRVAWSYPDPTRAFVSLRDHVAFYASPFDRCSVDGATVVPQPGDFYGGWITPDLAGPFKGVPGSMGW